MVTGACLSAMEWPVTDSVIERNFGWNDEGQPVLGIVYKTDDDIKAAEHGEVLFIGDDKNNASGLPSPLGTWIGLDHGGGIIGVYSRVGSAENNIQKVIERSSVIGVPGTSGWSDTKGVYFSLYDRREKRWINPVMIISPLPDTGAPSIQSVRLRSQEGRTLELRQDMTITQGRYAILVDSSQIFPNRAPLAPYKISCSVNGIETGRLNFETYSARDGALSVYRNGLVPVRQIYAAFPFYELGSVNFTRGQATMEVITADAANNQRSQSFRFTVE